MAGRVVTRITAASAIAGGAVWIVVLALFVLRLPVFDQYEVLLLLAQLVMAPLVISLLARSGRLDEFRWSLASATLLQPLAAIATLIAFVAEDGGLQLLTGVWAMVTGLLAVHGLTGLFSPGGRSPDELCLSAGLLYLPVGAAWLVAARLGIAVLGFATPIVTLTAIHFHFISLAGLILTGMAGRAIRQYRPALWLIYRVAAPAVIVSPALVAAGISLSPLVEVVGALILVAGLVVVAALVLAWIVPVIKPLPAKLMLAVSHGLALLAMAFAAIYALGEFGGAWAISIPDMLRYHGWINAVGFGLVGLLGWTFAERSEEPAARIPAPSSLAPLLDGADVLDHKTATGRATLREFLARMVWHQPWWMTALYGVRAVFVRLLGMRQRGVPHPPRFAPEEVPFTPGQAAYFFTVRAAEEDRFWLADVRDKHLDAGLAVIAEPLEDGRTRFHVVTVVHYNDWRGPLYLTAIWPFHHLVVGSMMRAGVRLQTYRR